jgi:hypothetical protein
MPLSRRIGYKLLARTLRHTFRRIVWVGPWDPPPADTPVILYANHHAFYDAQVLGFLLECVLERHTIVWMEDLDRFPFLAVLGAQTFPRNDGSRRFRTIRETQRLMARRPNTALIYFPEGDLHGADEGVHRFPPDQCLRVGSVLPSAQWWPVGLRIADWHDATPTVYLNGAPAHATPDGNERERLTTLLQDLNDPADDIRRVLLEGRPGPHERWNMSRLARVFYR